MSRLRCCVSEVDIANLFVWARTGAAGLRGSQTCLQLVELRWSLQRARSEAEQQAWPPWHRNHVKHQGMLPAFSTIAVRICNFGCRFQVSSKL